MVPALDDTDDGDATTDDEIGGDERYCPACTASFAPVFEYCPDDGTRLIRWRAEDTSMIGAVLDGRYRIDAPIGQGGMGIVYRGLQLSIERPVAIKVIRDLGHDRATAKRFLREARLLTTFNHPNIVNVFELGQTETGALYLVMELLRGRTLDVELARTGPFGARRTCEVAIQLCDALAAAHTRGVVHRDLKPANIILLEDPAVRDLVKVLDFGLAKSLAPDAGATTSALTAAGVIMGTPLYMPPEVISGEVIDPRSDLYALGCIMYELLAGAPVFADPAVNVILTRQLVEPPPPLPAGVPAPLAQLVYALLAKSPEQRPATAAGVRADLLAMLDGSADPWDLDEAETLNHDRRPPMPGDHAALRPSIDRTLPRLSDARPPGPPAAVEARAPLIPVVIVAIALAVASFLIALALI